MPIFALYTNLSKDKIPGDFMRDASFFLARHLGKPESYMTVRVHPDQMIIHGGKSDPCGSVEIYSIGTFGPSVNQGHAKEIGQFIEANLNIPQDRFFITFVDLKASNIGLNGKTIDQILK